jgi:pSer/pThr/pTyr-binding forkhead associated (FHA) protein
MPSRLVPLNSEAAPVVVLQRPVVLIGRHPECDVRLDVPQVSRRHCCVALAYDRLLIRDLGSRNGVRVNGKRVDEATLYPGDEVAIAQVIFRLEEFSPLAAVPPRAGAKPVANPASTDLPLPVNDSDMIALDDDLILDD